MKRMVRKPEKERRLESELTHHLESLIAAHRAAGLSEAEARRQARLEFGALEAVKDDCRDARRTAFLEFCLQDLRLAGRALRKSPAFACAAMATLALGIGANTAIFQLLDTVFLRPLSVSEPQQLVTIRIRGGTSFGISDGNDRLTLPLFEGI
ncbi:MAG TPA: permease prefix domain 1-containing protein, partial [Bryobacteraceae bacterium]|nr:permease prefix domain 1-containing protein [Bryobacteraceae bacterium]